MFMRSDIETSTHSQRYNADNHYPECIIEVTGHTRESLATNDTVENKEGLHHKHIEHARYDGSEIPVSHQERTSKVIRFQ